MPAHAARSNTMKIKRILLAFLISFSMIAGAAGLHPLASTGITVDNSLYGELLKKYVRDGKSEKKIGS
jgi:hypothetical protein